MTVCFRALLVPRDRRVVPRLDAIASLVARLRRERWVLTPDSPAFEDAWQSPPSPTDAHRTGGWAEPFVERPENRRARDAHRVAIPIPVDAAWLASRMRDDHPQAGELSLRFTVNAAMDDWESLGMPYPFDRGKDETGYHDIVIDLSRDWVRPLFADSEPCLCACGEDLAYEVERVVAPIEARGRVRARCPRCGAPFDANREDARARAIHRFAVAIDCQEGWPREKDSQEQQMKAEIMRRAGYEVTDMFGRPVPPPEDRPRDPDPAIVRSPYGDAAPNVEMAFRSIVEETIGSACDVVSEFT